MMLLRSIVIPLRYLFLWLAVTVFGWAKPNIILIMADDLGWSEVGFNGSSYYETPQLDKLAEGGLIFTNAYAPSANCAPSRACILTGQNTPRHGMYTVNNSDRGEDTQRKLIPTENIRVLPYEFPTLASILGENGYATAAVGKWHISPSPSLQGFDFAFAGNLAGHPKTYWAPYQVVDVKGQKGEYLTDRVTDEAIGFIERSKDQPFFLYLPFFAVHDPLQGKPELVAKYEKKTAVNGQGRYPDYSAMIENMDTQIGRIVETLDVLGLDDDTTIIFTSDNGGAEWISSQYPLKAGKGAYYEGGIRAPLLFHGNAVTKLGTSNAIASGLDLYPTILDLAGILDSVPATFDGISLVDILNGASAGDSQRNLFWHFPIYLHAHKNVAVPDGVRDPYFRTRPGSVIRSGKWKLHQYFEDDALELYDLSNDIGEKRDLAESNPEKVQELLTLLENWRNQMNAPVPQELNPLYDPSIDYPGYEADPNAKPLKYVSDQNKG